MPGRTANVRYWSEIGLNADIGLWAGFDPGCVKTHTLKECGKYNSPTRNRAVYPQHDLTLMMRNFLETFYARCRRWSFHTRQDPYLT
jgi:hypothetical protein